MSIGSTVGNMGLSMAQRECDYIYQGKLGDLNTCTLTGRACLSLEDWKHCLRREFALRYQLEHTQRTSMAKPQVTIVCSEDSPLPPLPST